MAALVSLSIALPVSSGGVRFNEAANMPFFLFQISPYEQGRTVDTAGPNDFGISSMSAQEQIAAAQERARASLEAVRLHNEAIMRDSNERASALGARNRELVDKLNSAYSPVPVTPPPAVASAAVAEPIEPTVDAAAAAPPAAPQQAAEVQQPPTSVAEYEQPTVATEAATNDQPMISTNFDRKERPVQSGNRYTTGVRISESPAFVEVPVSKRIDARRITESRLLYRPIYAEQRWRLEMPNSLHGAQTFVTGDPRNGRIVGENEGAPGTPLAEIAGADGWTTLDQDSNRNGVNDNKFYTTGVRVSEAPAQIEISGVKRVPARRLVCLRLALLRRSTICPISASPRAALSTNLLCNSCARILSARQTSSAAAS